MPEIKLSQGIVTYSDDGEGPAVVLIHGLLVNGSVWNRVAPALASRARCIVPELPLGSHSRPMTADAELSPAGVASLIAELIEAVGLDDVTLVGNDTGGALCQLVVAAHPERIGRLVLTNCDAFDHFPPAKLRLAVTALARVPGALVLVADLGRLRVVRRASLSVAPLTVDPVPDELLKSWLVPLRRHGIRRDLLKVLRGISPSVTLAVAERLPEFDRPVMIVWGAQDAFFPVEDAERLAALFADARLERVDGARTFVQLDAPDRLAELILEHAQAPAAAAA